MFGKRAITEKRFVTRDGKGLLELWQEMPDFVPLGEEAFFIDAENDHNQMDIDTPVNRLIVDRFLVLNNTCQVVQVHVSKKGVSVSPGRTFSYKREETIDLSEVVA